MCAQYNKRKVDSSFEKAYIKARQKEERVLSIDQIKQLPFLEKNHPRSKEWELRVDTFKRFQNYLNGKSNIRVLDLACGNGWMINQLVRPDLDFVGMEINQLELEQAYTVLTDRKNVELILADVFEYDFDDGSFDVIYLSGAVQYFQSISKLIKRLQSIGTDQVEIHFLDSPFYSSLEEAEKAKSRSRNYYQSIETPEMESFYFHHSVDDLDSYSYELKYNPRSIKQRVMRKLGMKKSPFPWMIIHK